MGILNRNRDDPEMMTTPIPDLPVEDEGPTIPESERPNVEAFSGDSFEFGEPEYEPEPEPAPSGGGKPTYFDADGVERYVGSNRRKRSDSGRPRVSTRGKRGKPVAVDPGAAGGTVLYGGIGAVLSMSGIAPAAGLSMQGLADEAGPEISAWAKKRSPRFYEFLCTISESSGLGKYVAAPVSAEAYLRMERARPALEPMVVSIHGPESREAFQGLAFQYDQWKAAEAAAMNADMNGGASDGM